MIYMLFYIYYLAIIVLIKLDINVDIKNIMIKLRTDINGNIIIIKHYNVFKKL